MDLSVVIVNWNTCNLLRGCLRSIFQQTHDVSFEIIVIDNASIDGSAEMVQDEFPSVLLIKNSINHGFAKANNQGIHRSGGRYLLLLNPDTIVLDSAIDKCVRYADAHTNVGIVGCQVLEDEQRIQRTGFSFPSPWNLFLTLSGLSRVFPHSRLFGGPELGWWDRNSEQDLDVISGMFMLVRRQAMEKVGLMDESYFVYAEEADWCYRFFLAGWRRVFIPFARIVHLDGGGKSTSQVNIKMFVQMQKSIMIYFRKNLGFGSWLAGKIIYIISNTLRLVAWYLGSIVCRDQSMRHKSIAAAAALRFHVFGIQPA